MIRKSDESFSVKNIVEDKINRPSVKRRILLYLLAFTAATLSLIWLFQITLFPAIYKRVRISETKSCASKMLDLSADEYEDSSSALSERYDICITVFKIQNRIGTVETERHVNSNCFIHNMYSDPAYANSYFTSIYTEVKNNGGLLQSAPLFGSRYANSNETEASDDGANIIYAVLSESSDGEYLMLFNTETYPLASTVSTVRTILGIISLILIILSVIISLLISAHMTRPIANMSREAAKLALGDYDVHFDGGAYRETGELADTLDRAARELSALDRMQKDLIGNISHDLRTPLTMIKGYGEVMRDIPGEMTAENMQVIIDETERLSSLVSDLLDASRMMSSSQQLDIKEFSVTEAVEETVNRFSKLCERDGYKILFERDSNAIVRADKTRILQVIYNLIGNAINYTGDDKTVTIMQTVKDDSCRISITDSGEGIPECELPMIWERYYKSGRFHKRPSQGSGIGLSIVKNALIMHGARFGVSSSVGIGSTFWFELKIAD